MPSRRSTVHSSTAVGRKRWAISDGRLCFDVFDVFVCRVEKVDERVEKVEKVERVVRVGKVERVNAWF